MQGLVSVAITFFKNKEDFDSSSRELQRHPSSVISPAAEAGGGAPMPLRAVPLRRSGNGIIWVLATGFNLTHNTETTYIYYIIYKKSL